MSIEWLKQAGRYIISCDVCGASASHSTGMISGSGFKVISGVTGVPRHHCHLCENEPQTIVEQLEHNEQGFDDLFMQAAREGGKRSAPSPRVGTAKGTFIPPMTDATREQIIAALNGKAQAHNALVDAQAADASKQARLSAMAQEADEQNSREFEITPGMKISTIGHMQMSKKATIKHRLEKFGFKHTGRIYNCELLLTSDTTAKDQMQQAVNTAKGMDIGIMKESEFLKRIGKNGPGVDLPFGGSSPHQVPKGLKVAFLGHQGSFDAMPRLFSLHYTLSLGKPFPNPDVIVMGVIDDNISKNALAFYKSKGIPMMSQSTFIEANIPTNTISSGIKRTFVKDYDVFPGMGEWKSDRWGDDKQVIDAKFSVLKKRKALEDKAAKASLAELANELTTIDESEFTL